MHKKKKKKTWLGKVKLWDILLSQPNTGFSDSLRSPQFTKYDLGK